MTKKNSKILIDSIELLKKNRDNAMIMMNEKYNSGNIDEYYRMEAYKDGVQSSISILENVLNEI